jgi:SAM-dependent methyltransferase
MASQSDPGVCAVCRTGAREIVQTQNLVLLGHDAPCAIHFSACRACGHLQQWPPVPPELMAHHYRSFATYELFGAPDALRAAPPSRHAARFLSLARDIGLTPGRAYEVGCASGEMLNQFRRQGWQVGGCDPSPSAIAQAKTIFGIESDLGGEEDTLPQQQDLDLILICHVLEHLYDPAAALARFHDALAPGGHLLLEVPCATAPEILPPGWFTFEHLHYYQPAILERLLARAGFDVVEMRIAMRAEHYPVIAVAARKAAPAHTEPVCNAEAALALARDYVARDAAFWAGTGRKLADITGPAFIYGGGIHTAQLLDHTGFAHRARVIAIADRDSKKWGQTLAGHPMISPAQLFADERDAPVIISSYVSERAIARALLDGGIAPQRIRTLYHALPA